LTIAVFILYSLVPPVGGKITSPNHPDHDGLKWGRWIAENVHGKLAIIEGADLIAMHLHDNKSIRLSALRPGYFENLDTALEWFKKEGVTHLAIDDLNIHRRSYLKEINDNSDTSELFEEVYSNYGSDSKWKIRVYVIHW
jgi:hypothetical protein